MRHHCRLRKQRLIAAKYLGTHDQYDWMYITAEFNNRCVRCGIDACHAAIEKDHIIPLVMGGSDAAENLQPLCKRCNVTKGADTTDWAAYRRERGFKELDGDGG